MNNVTVAVIWRSRPNMLEVKAKAHAWWLNHGIEPVFVDSPLTQWSCAAARNLAVKSLGRHGVPIVLCDADTHPADWATLVDAINQCAEHPDAVYLPYTTYQVTRLDGTIRATFDWSVSGMFVTTPETWWAVGGQDERFTRWSPEDFAFTMAHTAILGEPLRRVEGTVVAYAHDSNPGKDDPEPDAATKALFERYKDAAADRDAMIDLVNEWQSA